MNELELIREYAKVRVNLDNAIESLMCLERDSHQNTDIASSYVQKVILGALDPIVAYREYWEQLEQSKEPE